MDRAAMESTLALLGWECVVDQWPTECNYHWNLQRGDRLVSYELDDRTVMDYSGNLSARPRRDVQEMPDHVFNQLAPRAMELSHES